MLTSGTIRRQGKHAFALFVFALSTAISVDYAEATKHPAAPTYFVDFDNGSDFQSGLSPETAWKTIPGTRNAGDTKDITESYGGGRVSTSRKVQPGTVFLLKGGSTHDKSNGGVIQITRRWYENANAATPITFRRHPDWGDGVVTIDGAGVTVGIALVLVQRDGVEFDGGSTDGITVQNSMLDGVQFKEHAGTGAALRDLTVRQMKFFNNSTAAYDNVTGSAASQLSFRRAHGVLIENVTVDGGHNWSNGIFFGESSREVTDALVVNVVARNLVGALQGNDSGIGFKALNSQLTITECISEGNLKGADLGHHGSVDFETIYTVKNSTIKSNVWGLNLNSAATATFSKPVVWNVINNIVTGNKISGMHLYSGPYTAHVVHNLLYENGNKVGIGGRGGGCQWVLRPDRMSDEGKMVIHAYNNLLMNSTGSAIGLTTHFSDENSDWTLDQDFNAYEQAAAKYFWRWGYHQRSEYRDFKFGDDGPGHKSGAWHTCFGNDPLQPAKGTGHYHADGNSKGTGASDPTLPKFTDEEMGLFTLTEGFPGVDLSTKIWYTRIMGVDRRGNARSAWDMGPFEFVPPTTISSESFP